MDEQKMRDCWYECNHPRTKKAVCRAAVIALAGAVSSFAIYVLGWRRGIGDVADSVADYVKKAKEDKEMEEDLQ